VLKAWYPAAAASGEATRIDYPLSLKSPDWQALQPAVVHGRAIRDVPVSSARETYPLVVFSHGYALSPEWYSRLVEHLASWGFIVLAPEHQESDWFAAHEALIRRPADARDALDFLSTKGDLPQAIDPERIALVGHSFGGYTALAVGGARLDLAPLEARCGALTPEDPKQFLCAPFVGKAKEMAALAGLGEVPPGLWPAAADPRIKAILPIAGDAYVFGEAGLASVQIPVMAMGGTEDFGAPWDWGAGLAYEHAGSASKALVGLEGGSHMLAANPCSDFPWAGLLPPMEQGLFCLDPVWDRDRALDLIEHYATAFLLDTLTQSPEARAALLPSAPQPAGIRLQSPE
jgi:predicted dienelactone hydrolase